MPNTVEEMGVEGYLNATKGLHNNKGFDEFMDMLKLKVPKTEIAKQFNVTTPTIHNWLKRLNKENI